MQDDVKKHAAVVKEPVGIDGDSVKKRYDDRSLLNWDKANRNLKKSPNLIGFNETEYITKAHKNKDAYKLNAFNQEESDKLHSDRSVPDTRNYQYVQYVCM